LSGAETHARIKKTESIFVTVVQVIERSRNERQLNFDQVIMLEYRKSTDNTHASLPNLENILNTFSSKFKAYTDEELSIPPAPDKWSRKQIIGHLLDSATNNHHRFVRAQFDEKPVILYDQEKWNQYGYYDQMDGEHLINFWELYNRHLISLIRNIPPELLQRECKMGDGSTRTIAWLFDDYVRHMEHHLAQIIERVNV
jgi:hypothetical protein